MVSVTFEELCEGGIYDSWGLIRDGTCDFSGVSGTVSVTLTGLPEVLSVIFTGYMKVAPVSIFRPRGNDTAYFNAFSIDDKEVNTGWEKLCILFYRTN